MIAGAAPAAPKAGASLTTDAAFPQTPLPPPVTTRGGSGLARADASMTERRGLGNRETEAGRDPRLLPLTYFFLPAILPVSKVNDRSVTTAGVE